MEKQTELKKYIVCCEERSDGPQCNRDRVWLVVSPIEPTADLMEENGLLNTGYCTNMTYPGCEECGGSYVASFSVEPYSPKRARELGLVEELGESDGVSSLRYSWPRRLHP